MDFELAEEHRMLKDLVANFVRDELMPLEAGVLAREAEGKGLGIGEAEYARLDRKAHELGLFGLDGLQRRRIAGARAPRVTPQRRGTSGSRCAGAAVKHHAVRRDAIFRPAQKRPGGFAGERDVGPRMPAAQPSGPAGVVVEEKIVDGMLFPARGPHLVRIRPPADARLVLQLALGPVGLGENGQPWVCFR